MLRRHLFKLHSSLKGHCTAAIIQTAFREVWVVCLSCCPFLQFPVFNKYLQKDDFIEQELDFGTASERKYWGQFTSHFRIQLLKVTNNLPDLSFLKCLWSPTKERVGDEHVTGFSAWTSLPSKRERRLPTSKRVANRKLLQFVSCFQPLSRLRLINVFAHMRMSLSRKNVYCRPFGGPLVYIFHSLFTATGLRIN